MGLGPRGGSGGVGRGWEPRPRMFSSKFCATGVRYFGLSRPGARNVFDLLVKIRVRPSVFAPSLIRTCIRPQSLTQKDFPCELGSGRNKLTRRYSRHRAVGWFPLIFEGEFWALAKTKTDQHTYLGEMEVPDTTFEVDMLVSAQMETNDTRRSSLLQMLCSL